MSYIALYRKWRPLLFEDVVGQEHVVKILKNSVCTGRIAHAYLFCGTRGTGKTTMAKIFSRAINCLNPNHGDPCNECDICKGILSGNLLDVIEIDAASNNSVDNVREIRDEVIYTPSRARFKVYIIDEVHMLSPGAFNALLKTLEEPPAHAVFILATTEPHKLPATILSRCQRFDFRRIPTDSIMDRLYKISQASGVDLKKDASKLIAKMSDGALRDAISILDQCISVGNKEICYNDVLGVVGIVNDAFIGELVDAINASDINLILQMIEKLVMDGKDITRFVSDMVLYYRNLLICKITGAPEDILDVSGELLDRMKKQCLALEQNEIMMIIKEFSSLESGLKWSAHPRTMLELSIIKICDGSYSPDKNSILERLAVLENRINNTDFTVKKDSDGSTAQGKKATEASKGKKAQKSEAHCENGDSKISSADLKTIDNWKNIVEELKKSGRMVLYTNLLDTKAVEMDSRIIGIVFKKANGFSKMILSKPENLELIEEILKGRLGREVRVKCIDEEDFIESGKTLEQEDEKDELLEKAQSIAERFNVPLNIIEE